ncbi:hypothetical protein Pmani_019820 [Petrolisthes manimaculis]|uniref:Uncharacterized protein n=1 Tax=Petrolisthes manimaculis TaxID=1843537 RepID=A0AAE1PJZ1_9EUCA|nr:hypothetical protein Pmani_019820 [Petrolisthes manimaculis]
MKPSLYQQPLLVTHTTPAAAADHHCVSGRTVVQEKLNQLVYQGSNTTSPKKYRKPLLVSFSPSPPASLSSHSCPSSYHQPSPLDPQLRPRLSLQPTAASSSPVLSHSPIIITC